MKKIVVIALVVLVVGGLVNDVSRYAKARYDAANITNEILDLLQTRGTQARNSNASLAASHAAAQGATVYLYDQDEQRAYVWVEMPVSGTWLLGPVNASMTGQPPSSPYMVRLEDSIAFR
jgi:hypothetical protein